MDPALILAAIIAGLGGLGGLAGVVGYLRGTYAKTTIEALRKDISDWENRYDALEQDLATEKERTGALQTGQREDAIKLEALKETLAAKADFNEIASILTTHDQRAQSIEKVMLEVAKKVGLDPS